jgi:hypothetical protein
VGLTAVEQASPLAKRPYELRHACVSYCLSRGISIWKPAELPSADPAGDQANGSEAA